MKAEMHSCKRCKKLHPDESCSIGDEFFDYGYCSAECFYEDYVLNPENKFFVSFPEAKNYDKARKVMLRLKRA